MCIPPSITGLLWIVWIERNNRIFKDKSRFIVNLWEDICNLIGVWSRRHSSCNQYDVNYYQLLTLSFVRLGCTGLPSSLQPCNFNSIWKTSRMFIYSTFFKIFKRQVICTFTWHFKNVKKYLKNSLCFKTSRIFIKSQRRVIF